MAKLQPSIVLNHFHLLRYLFIHLLFVYIVNFSSFYIIFIHIFILKRYSTDRRANLSVVHNNRAYAFEYIGT